MTVMLTVGGEVDVWASPRDRGRELDAMLMGKPGDSGAPKESLQATKMVSAQEIFVDRPTDKRVAS